MKLAAFNLQSLFDRAIALNGNTWAEGKPALNDYANLNALLNKTKYSAADKQRILQGLDRLGVLKKDDAGQFVVLRQNRGKLLKRPKNKPVEVVANGRADWIGWLELKTEAVNEVATRNTAQVIRDVAADIFALVEVEDRMALTRFNKQLLPVVGAAPYGHLMLIDGNDERGIDVAIMTKQDYPIVSMRSHVDDRTNGSLLFSRDCPEYEVQLPSGDRLLILVNHFKSKGYGGTAASNTKREAQASRVREIYNERRQAGVRFIAITGDLNDTPHSVPLAPLLTQGSDLRDISAHQTFVNDGHPGTFGTGTKSHKFDYILLSPDLFAKVTAAGVFRKGVWGGTHGTLWPIYPEMTRVEEAASDHAAVWVEIDL